MARDFHNREMVNPGSTHIGQGRMLKVMKVKPLCMSAGRHAALNAVLMAPADFPLD